MCSHATSNQAVWVVPCTGSGRAVGAHCCAPLRYSMCRWIYNGAPRSYPRAPSLAAYAAIHLVAPYGIPLYKKWRMDDRLANSPFRLAKSRLRRLLAGRPLRWVSPFSILNYLPAERTKRTGESDSCRSRHSAANYRSGCSGSAGSGHSGHRPRGRANRSA